MTVAITRSFAEANDFRIATKHPLNSRVEILPYKEGIEKIDLETMNMRNYEDEESRTVCMAECLAPSPVVPESFHCIFVPDKETQDTVKSLKEKYRSKARFFIQINDGLSRKAITE